MAFCHDPLHLKRSVPDARLPAFQLSSLALLGGQAPHSFCCKLESSVKMCNAKALCFLAFNLIHAEPQNHS